jgi:hypothetical protein
MPNSKKEAAFKTCANEIDYITQRDREFFEKIPGRRFRVRRAVEAEIRQLEIVTGHGRSKGDAYAVIYKCKDPTIRFRQFYFYHGKTPLIVDDEGCFEIFKACLSYDDFNKLEFLLSEAAPALVAQKKPVA